MNDLGVLKRANAKWVLLAALLLLAVLLTLTVFSSYLPAKRGGLIQDSSAALCLPKIENAPLLVAVTILDNVDGSDDVFLDAVELVNAEGITMVGAWVLPIEDWSQKIVNGDTLDTALLANYPEISTHTPPRVEAGASYGLVVAAESDNEGGSYERTRVRYHSDKRAYYSIHDTDVSIPAPGEGCS